MNRGGVTSLELVAALGAAALVAWLAVVGMRERRALGRAEERAAALEMAQNLLDAERAGLRPELPAGWTRQELAAAPGVRVVTVVGPQRVRLSTLCREEGR